MRNPLHRVAGHAWTILPTLSHIVAPPALPSTPWSTTAHDPTVGDVVIRGKYARAQGDTLIVAIHGLGGSPDSAYLTPIVQAAADRGWSSLRLALRGTEGIGNDFYHAGMSEDVSIALRDPAFAHYEHVFVIGFSLGGHIAMCVATEPDADPRVRGVAAICPPIDLAAAATMLDEPAQALYRHYILRELRALYRGVARTAAVPTPWSRIALVRKIREWDALTIVPRFGFDDVEDYYRRVAMAHRIEAIGRPTLMVHSHDDPVVIPAAIYPVLDRAPPLFDARWFAGAGHVFFPPGLDLREPGPRGLGPQVLSWLETRATTA